MCERTRTSCTVTVQCVIVTVQCVTVQCVIVTIQCVTVACVPVSDLYVCEDKLHCDSSVCHCDSLCVIVQCVPVSDLYVCEDEDKLHCEEVADSKLCSRDDDYARHCPRSCGMCGRSCLSFTD